jgi:hypothetical protein
MKKKPTEKAEDITEGLSAVLGGLFAAAQEARRKDPMYLKLWDSDGIESLLRKTEHAQMSAALDASQVLEDKFGIKATAASWLILKSLPQVIKTLEDDFVKTEGISCCVDKAYYITAKLIREAK